MPPSLDAPGPIEFRTIAIIGCGALGSAFAGLLANAGEHVVAACRWREHREHIREHGLALLEDGAEFRVPMEVVSESAVSRGLPPSTACDLAIVLVKSFDTERTAAGLSAWLAPGTPVLTLQNGLGNAEALAVHLKRHPILAGTTTFAAQRDRPGAVRLTGRGECEIGAWNRDAEACLEPVAKLLSRSGIPCSISPDVRSVIWKKLAVNAVINSLTAILRVRNGELLRHKEVVPTFVEGVGEVACTVVEELCRVAGEYRIALPTAAELLQEIRRVCRTTAANRSSMCRDAEQGRRTEIDAINGALVRLAHERGLDAPANRLLASLVKASSRLSMPGSAETP